MCSRGENEIKRLEEEKTDAREKGGGGERNGREQRSPGKQKDRLGFLSSLARRAS